MNLAPSELEARITGAVLARGDAIHALPAGFRSSAMETDWRRPFEALERLQKRGALPSGAVDLALVVAEAKMDAAAVTNLDRAVYEAGSSTAGNVAEHARMVLDRYRRRELRSLLDRAATALSGDAPTEEIVGKVTARLLDLDTSDRPETRCWRDAATEWVDAVNEERQGRAVALTTGFTDLDHLLRIKPGNLVVLGARPSVGKSTLALNIADNVALTGKHALVHSLEMDDAELVTLAMSRATKTDSMAFGDRDSVLDGDRLMTEVDRRCRLSPDGDGTLHFNTAHHALGTICRITEKMHRKHGLALVVVDYLQLVECKLGKGFNRNDEVATVARTLKLMAMRLRLPVLALSQLNRASELRNERAPRPRAVKNGPPAPEPDIPPPVLADLRESGAIEQDANAVLFLHNPKANSKDDAEKKRGPYQLTIAKQRGGKKGRVLLRAELEYARFLPFAFGEREMPKHWQRDGEAAP